MPKRTDIKSILTTHAGVRHPRDLSCYSEAAAEGVDPAIEVVV
jgi:hypothetical protein